MRLPTIDDRVELLEDVPELSLKKGDVGIVSGTWSLPAESYAYEVNFECAGPVKSPVRALLMLDQITLKVS